MKKETKNDELRSEYELSGLKNRVRGKYVERYAAESNVVLLEPDVAESFPDPASVNAALRMLIEVANHRSHRAQ